ncbi:MAG: peptidoglycan DD-metalloendopeptidase family protein, partial [Sulfurovaceae bacterium]|nr:peptidoglycan DD-metalloendopeptidase family protein [Sulfurovaceae bacterium]
MKKIIVPFIILSALSISLSAKTYYWKKGYSFLSFLRNNDISQKLYYELDSDDKEILEEIQAGQSYSVKKGKKQTTFLIPITDEIQVKVTKPKKGKSKIELRPIPFEILKGSIHISLKHSWNKDLYAKTHSKALIKELKESYKSLNLNKMRKGDEINIFYTQKRRKGKAISSPIIQASMITIKKKKYYSYLANDGRYYDSNGKEYDKKVVIKKVYSKFIRPVSRCFISSGFTRSRYHPVLHRYRAHLGVDYATCYGTPIRATASGKIVRRGWRGGYGNCISIKHAHGITSLYGHMSRFRKGLHIGSYVKQGTVIGYVGSTGISTGPHVHFGLYKHGKAVNPARYVRLNGTKRTTIVKRLKGKEYRKLRKKVIAYRKKFRRISKT